MSPCSSSGSGTGVPVDLVVAVVLARLLSILICHEGRSSRLGELELPDGATGLDAARAIGPKLAEQAVLIRPNGNVQDLRLPLADGQPIQILTTRDTEDPDALDGAAPLGRAPARRGRAAALPGREDRDRAADRERLLLRLRVPRADPRGRSRADRGRDPARAEGGPLLGARGDLARRRRSSASRPRTSRTRSSSSTRPRATSRCTRRASSPISAAARTCRTRSRSRRSSSPRSPARTGAATSRTRS